ncbi:hypothetical protein D9C73_000194 [Collichthys lucidus]|uniref:Uncharacterized protein n=1 Tax=Collichthys lucidus TaxID=240159 RepID=A0A4U5TXX1_COLLU|nr:hypothetical protein D9C73_000194 [Collichthys lucidus]
MDSIYGHRPANSGREGGLDSATSILESLTEDDYILELEEMPVDEHGPMTPAAVVPTASTASEFEPPRAATPATVETPRAATPAPAGSASAPIRRKRQREPEHVTVLRDMQASDVEQQELNREERERHVQAALDDASHSHTSSTPHASPTPSPASSALSQQILSCNYVHLAQLIHPSTYNPHIPRELQPAAPGTFQLKQPLTTHSKELSAPKFTLTFSLYRDVICPAFPDRRSEPDDYPSLIIDLASRFGGNGFYSYHIPFASRALLPHLRSTSIPPLRSVRRTITSSHHLLHHHSAFPYFSPTKSQPGSF